MLQPGDKVPAFKGLDQNGQSVAYKDFKGQKLVIYFYPKDNTPACTAQACSLRDGEAQLKKMGIQVVGISTDDVKSHKKFETKFGLPFPLIADTDHAIAEAFGVWGPKKFMGREYIGLHRTTFLVDEKGKIKAVIARPDTKNHAAEVLAAWQTA